MHSEHFHQQKALGNDHTTDMSQEASSLIHYVEFTFTSLFCSTEVQQWKNCMTWTTALWHYKHVLQLPDGLSWLMLRISKYEGRMEFCPWWYLLLSLCTTGNNLLAERVQCIFPHQFHDKQRTLRHQQHPSVLCLWSLLTWRTNLSFTFP